jgi:hypothetical protein
VCVEWAAGQPKTYVADFYWQTKSTAEQIQEAAEQAGEVAEETAGALRSDQNKSEQILLLLPIISRAMAVERLLLHGVALRDTEQVQAAAEQAEELAEEEGKAAEALTEELKETACMHGWMRGCAVYVVVIMEFLYNESCSGGSGNGGVDDGDCNRDCRGGGQRGGEAAREDDWRRRRGGVPPLLDTDTSSPPPLPRPGHPAAMASRLANVSCPAPCRRRGPRRR